MKTGILTIIVILVVGLLVWYLFFRPFTNTQTENTQPTPSLFASPSQSSPSGNQSTAAPSAVITTLPTKYITPVDWPPKVQALNQPLTCTEAGKETDRAGQTRKVIINNKTYCVTKITEGAAGSIYTQYAYALEKGNQTEIYTFSLKFSQCGNYPDLEKNDCETERQTFNIDNFMDQYINSQNK